MYKYINNYFNFLKLLNFLNFNFLFYNKVCFGLVIWFSGISILEGYVISNLAHTHTDTHRHTHTHTHTHTWFANK